MAPARESDGEGLADGFAHIHCVCHRRGCLAADRDHIDCTPAEATGSIDPLLNRFKYKDLELEFGRRLEEAKQEAKELPAAVSEQKSLPKTAASPFMQRIITLASALPRAAVLEAWREVEDAARAAAEHLDILDHPTARNPASVVRALNGAQQTAMIVPLLNDLRALRNEAAHSHQFALSEESAIDYGRLAEQSIQYLRAVIESGDTGGYNCYAFRNKRRRVHEEELVIHLGRTLRTYLLGAHITVEAPLHLTQWPGTKMTRSDILDLSRIISDLRRITTIFTWASPAAPPRRLAAPQTCLRLGAVSFSHRLPR